MDILNLDSVLKWGLRVSAVVVVFVSAYSFLFWIFGALFFADNPNFAALGAVLVAFACAGLVWWKNSASPASVSQFKEVFGASCLSRVLYCSALAGSVGFGLGFFGPMLFTPQNNLGPLLGIFVTGPAGVLLGPALAVASMVRNGAPYDPVKAWRCLVLGWGLACAYYTLSGGGIRVAAFVAVGLMVINFLVGMVLCASITRTQPVPASLANYSHSLLVGGVLIILVSLFPPVMQPYWGRTVSAGGAGLPWCAFLFDQGFEASHRIPLYAINVRLWLLEVLVVIVAMTVVYWLLGKLDAKRGAF